VLNGQKVWTSGAQHADVGYVIARTDRTVPRQRAMTAFLVEMDTPGVEVRPLRQMSGGSSFNEVFFTDVRVADSDRVGDVGAGWHAMMTTLGFERAAATGGTGGNDLFGRLVLLARHLGRDDDPVVRQLLADVYIERRVKSLTQRRAADRRRAGGVPGPEGSLGKLAYSNWLQHVSHVASVLLGPSLTADTGEWGTFAWTQLVNGAPGMRLGGGTDEIQRNTIAERVLGLPRDPR
jgi:alkylation response protein AidB-like acyl-CoA dehydrogenase